MVVLLGGDRRFFYESNVVTCKVLNSFMISVQSFLSYKYFNAYILPYFFCFLA